jgi:hypothetical protein
LERAEEYERIEYHEVDADIFDVQLAALENKLNELQNAHMGEASSSTGPVQSFPIKLEKRYAKGTNTFFYRRLEPQKQPINSSGHVPRYNVVQFPRSLAESLFRVMDFSNEYVFHAPKEAVKSSTRVNGKGAPYRLLEFERVPRVEPRTRALENKRTKVSGGHAPLN